MTVEVLANGVAKGIGGQELVGAPQGAVFHVVRFTDDATACETWAELDRIERETVEKFQDRKSGLLKASWWKVLSHHVYQGGSALVLGRANAEKQDGGRVLMPQNGRL